MTLACEDGKRLLDARDKAIAKTRTYEVGMRMTAVVTSEYKAIRAEYVEACTKVQKPAIAYNEHLVACAQCSVTPPRAAA
jgi:hypothetical protein